MKRLFEMVGDILGPKKGHPHFMALGGQAFNNGNYMDAEKEYARALETALEMRAHDDVAEISTKLGQIYERTDRLAVAETHYRRAHQTEEDSEHFEQSAKILVMLGRLYQKMRRLPDAEQVLNYSMAIYQQQFGANHAGIADAATTLADCYLDRNSYAEAERLLLRAISIDEIERGEGDPLVAEGTHKLAISLAGQNKDGDAEKAFKKAVRAFEKNAASYDKQTAHKACACYHDFVRFYTKKSRNADARPLVTKAMELAESYPGYLDEADLAEAAAAH